MKPHEKLRQLRKDRELSEKEVYLPINMPQQTYSSKERGYHKLTREDIAKLAAFFKVPENYFDADPLPVPILNYSLRDIFNMVVDILYKYINLAERLARVEEKLRLAEERERNSQRGG
jgi:transcriptional regulator with XRE-family HTH domain